MILMTKKMTRMILMTKMMTWRKYDTALSSAAAAGAELNGHLLTWAFLPVIVTVVMMMIISKYFKMFLNISKYLGALFDLSLSPCHCNHGDDDDDDEMGADLD